MEYTLVEMLKIATPLLAIGGAWGGAKVALNGTRERVKGIDNKLEAHIKEDEAVQRDMIDRAARIETKLDILMEKK